MDCQIMTIHPHMSKIIAYYDLLIYRCYSPVWNRNGEGKLQALEKEEEEKKKKKKKKKMMMMMMMIEKKKSNWIQVD